MWLSLRDRQSVGSDPYFVLFFGSAFLAVFFHAWLLLLRLCSSSINLRNTQLPHLQMFYVGLCTSLNGLLVVYASPTSRTSAFLQALLYNFTYVRNAGACACDVRGMLTTAAVYGLLPVSR